MKRVNTMPHWAAGKTIKRIEVAQEEKWVEVCKIPHHGVFNIAFTDGTSLAINPHMSKGLTAIKIDEVKD